jgi:hypothetical protein
VNIYLETAKGLVHVHGSDALIKALDGGFHSRVIALIEHFMETGDWIDEAASAA